MNWWGGASFSDWVWNVAFDGIGSTAIGTVVAVYFVLRTLRNDRALASEALAAQRDLDRSRSFEDQCHRLVDKTRTVKFATLERHHWRDELYHLALAVPADEPLLRSVLLAGHEAAAEFGADRGRRINVALSVQAALAKRIAVPTYFTDVDPEVGAHALEMVRQGERYTFEHG